jgi:hypothetical protein
MKEGRKGREGQEGKKELHDRIPGRDRRHLPITPRVDLPLALTYMYLLIRKEGRGEV